MPDLKQTSVAQTPRQARCRTTRLGLALWLVLALILLAAGGCRAETELEHEQEPTPNEIQVLTLPKLAAANLAGAPLRVVATTSIIGDIVAQVGGSVIDLTTLIGPGQDPHSYKPTAQDMAAVSRAHVIFVNGWDLEEALIQDLKDVGDNVPLVPVSAGVEPLSFGWQTHEENEPGHVEGGAYSGGVDPHTWFSIHNVDQWVENIEQVLSDLDPANAANYKSNAEVYLAELAALQAYVETQLAGIPAEDRLLVTNHDSFGYLAHEYDLEIVGTVIPAASTMAEPSASDLTELIAKMSEHALCTIFTEMTVNDKLAQTVAAELDGCAEVRVLKLYTGSVGPAGSDADSYIAMFRFNVDTIVKGLR